MQIIAGLLASDLPLLLDRILMMLDPSGLRWLWRSWLEVDRGRAFYDTHAVGYDATFIAGRVCWKPVLDPDFELLLSDRQRTPIAL